MHGSEPEGSHVDCAVTPLERATYEQGTRLEADASKFVPGTYGHRDVDESGLVFEGQESDAAAGVGALSVRDQPSHVDDPPVKVGTEFCSAQHAGRQVPSQIGEGVLPGGESGCLDIGAHLLGARQRWQVGDAGAYFGTR